MSEDQAAIYSEIVGGRDLIDWFGRVLSFHDAEIVSLALSRRSQSVLRIHAWNMTLDEEGFILQDRHAIVSFIMKNILDLQLDGFSHQNVIGGLKLRRGVERPERRAYLSHAPSPTDFEIEFEPCFGISGYIRCRELEVAVAPGLPDDVTFRES